MTKEENEQFLQIKNKYKQSWLDDLDVDFLINSIEKLQCENRALKEGNAEAWEEWNNFNEYNLSFFGLTSMAEEFIDTVQKAGYKGMIYSSKTYLENIWLSTEYDIWLAQYNTKVTYDGKYKMWQLCQDGKIDGISKNVDIDILYK